MMHKYTSAFGTKIKLYFIFYFLADCYQWTCKLHVWSSVHAITILTCANVCDVRQNGDLPFTPQSPVIFTELWLFKAYEYIFYCESGSYWLTVKSGYNNVVRSYVRECTNTVANTGTWSNQKFQIFHHVACLVHYMVYTPYTLASHRVGYYTFIRFSVFKSCCNTMLHQIYTNFYSTYKRKLVGGNCLPPYNKLGGAVPPLIFNIYCFK
jgi:hypothetical protein